jgi:hypothetical protein
LEKSRRTQTSKGVKNTRDRNFQGLEKTATTEHTEQTKDSKVWEIKDGYRLPDTVSLSFNEQAGGMFYFGKTRPTMDRLEALSYFGEP